MHISPEPNTGCWIWTGELSGHGYGRLWINNKRQMAHRYFYEQFVGSIPNNYEIDHICGIRSCCNPSHLTPVSRSENASRRKLTQDHCKHGHEFTSENTYVDKRGWRQCIACRNAATLRHKSGNSPLKNKAKSHCKRGHEFTAGNTRLDGKGRRYCRACARLRERTDTSRF